MNFNSSFRNMATAGAPDQYECPICMGPYEDPVMLICGHSFCRGCVADLVNNANGRLDRVSCPIDRRQGVLRGFASVNDLPTNYALRNMATAVPVVECKCPNCLIKKQVSICQCCDLMICAECKEEHAAIGRNNLTAAIQATREKIRQAQAVSYTHLTLPTKA